MNEARKTRFRGPLAVLLLGAALVIIGLFIATTSRLIPTSGSPYPGAVHEPVGGGLATLPLGIVLLATGIAIGAGVLGYLVGARRRR